MRPPWRATKRRESRSATYRVVLKSGSLRIYRLFASDARPPRLSPAGVVGVWAGAPTHARALDYDCSTSPTRRNPGAAPARDPYRLDATTTALPAKDLPCPCSSAPLLRLRLHPQRAEPPEPAPSVPEEESVAPSYKAYVACSRGRYRRRGRTAGARRRWAPFCAARSRSPTSSASIPSAANCAAEEQQAEAEVLYVNAVTTNVLGRPR